MALSMTTVVGQVRDLVDELTSLERVYAESETDANALPASLPQLPAAIVLAGESLGYILQPGEHRHTYEVEIWLFIRGGGLDGNASVALDAYQSLIEKFAVNVALGGRANSCIFSRQVGPVMEDYGGMEYLIRKVILRVSEQASATPAIGA